MNASAQNTSIQTVQSVFLLLLFFVALFAGLARRLQIPYPILLVIAGLLISLVPGIPRIALNPDLVFLVFLPPLLYSAAWTLSWREFQRNFASIARLAVGLVFFTVLGLALAAGTLLPGFTWRSAVLLGAVVAATDAIAATSIAQRVGLPQRIVDILEAESLVNDGTGLLALQLGLSLLLTPNTPSLVETAGRLVFLTGGGVAIGLAIAALVAAFERWVDDGPVEIVISILVPYATYLFADRIHVSGVIAVIACSMYMSRQSSAFMSPQVRLQTTAVWEALTFILNGLVFVLIGLQLPFVLSEISGTSHRTLFLYGLGFSVVLIGIRMVWVFGETYIAYAADRLFHKTCPAPPDPRSIFVLGWGGMRGVLSLAAAVSLPYTLPDGSRFAQRSMIIYLAFCLIVATLIVQGLSLPWLIRRLGLSQANRVNQEEQDARRVLLQEALVHLTRRRSKNRGQTEMLDELIGTYQRRLDAMPARRQARTADPRSPAQRDQTLRASAVFAVLQAERATLLRLRDEDQINDEVLRTLERELDLAESRVHTGSL